MLVERWRAGGPAARYQAELDILGDRYSWDRNPWGFHNDFWWVFAFIRPNPFSNGPGGRGGAQPPSSRPCPAIKQEFFSTLGPLLKRMGEVTETSPDYIASLAAYESGWLARHAQETHNPFGLTRAGGRNLAFPSYDAAGDYWLYRAGPNGQGYSAILHGAASVDAFLSIARNNGYNTANSNWLSDIKDVYNTSILPFKEACGFQP